MDKKNKVDQTFTLAGIFLIIIYLFVLVAKIPRYGLAMTFWYCDWLLIFSGIALIFNKNKFLSVLFIQALIIQLPGLIDATYSAFFPHGGFLDEVGYIYSTNYSLVDFIGWLKHYLPIPLFFIYFMHREFYTKKWFHIIVNLIIFFFIIGLSLIIAGPAQNINFVYQPSLTLSKLGFSSFYPLILIIPILAISLLLLWILPKLISLTKKNKPLSRSIIIFIFAAMVIISILGYIFSR